MASSQQNKTHAAVTQGGSALQRYKSVIVGDASWLKLIYFEFCQLMVPIPGMLGLALRKLFWPRLFGSCGKGTVFGTGVKLMHPGRIRLGKRVVISDNCVLDGRNTDADQAIVLDDDVMLAHGVIISCKDGTIQLGQSVGVGAYSVMQSTTGNPIAIGDNAIVGPRCYITGGGNYNIDRLDIPIAKQGMKVMGGSTLDAGVWLGANVTVLGGIAVGKDSIVGAGSVVSKNLPEQTISLGVPAKVVQHRSDHATPAATNDNTEN